MELNLLSSLQLKLEAIQSRSKFENILKRIENELNRLQL
jgi:hypothetical protein